MKAYLVRHAQPVNSSVDPARPKNWPHAQPKNRKELSRDNLDQMLLSVEFLRLNQLQRVDISGCGAYQERTSSALARYLWQPAGIT